MPRLRALTSWADRREGDEWDAGDEDARILAAPDLPGGQKAVVIDRAMVAVDSEPPAPAPLPPAAPAPQPDKRRYMRRDLRAET
jgi:hypothetical protein